VPEIINPYWQDHEYGNEKPKGEGERVPLREHRCASRKAFKGTDKNSIEVNHNCRSVVGHPGDHKCICNKRWPNTQTPTNNKENAK